MTEDYQGMSEAIAAQLLALIQGYDNRFVWDQDILLLWVDAAREARWTQHEAVQAIRAFYLRNAADEFISIGKLNAAIRAARQDQMSRDAAPSAALPRGPVDPDGRARLMREWQTAAAESRVRSKRQRELVLKHEDLRAALCAPLLGFSQPERWNGWVPPELDDKGARNDSPRRAALVALIEEAEKREVTG